MYSLERNDKSVTPYLKKQIEALRLWETRNGSSDLTYIRVNGVKKSRVSALKGKLVPVTTYLTNHFFIPDLNSWTTNEIHK